MKALQNLALLLVATLLLFSSCKKEELTPAPETTTSLSAETTPRPQAVEPLDNNSNRNFTEEEHLVIAIREEPCSRGGTSLIVYQKIYDDLQAALDLDLYNVEWFNDEFRLLSETDIVYCLSEPGFYKAIVWNKRTHETATLQYKIDNELQKVKKQGIDFSVQ